MKEKERTLVKRIPESTFSLFQRLARQLAPPPKLTIAEWADQNRWLGTDVSSVPGPWRTDFTPYLREIMDAINDPEVERVVIMSAARAGKTSVILNMLGYYIDHEPCPIMMVIPTIELGEAFSKENVAPLIRDTKVLREKVRDVRSRDSSNTIKQKMFPGGFLVVSGANSAASLSMRTIKILAFDEVDRAPDSAGSEGDPVSLAETRTQTYEGRGRKIVLTSTPTIKDSSRIEKAFKESSQERWHLPCPSCGEMQPLSWQRLDFVTLLHSCRECGAFHSRAEWLAGTGQWIAEKPECPTRGFHLNAMASPFVSWAGMVEKYRQAITVSHHGDFEQLKVFFNTQLGETWEIRGEHVNEETLMKRREVYHADVPDGVVVITIGVDTQDNRLCYEVVGWGAGKESWALEYDEIPGDPRVAGSPVWANLDAVIQRPRYYRNGRLAKVRSVAIDMGGHAPDQVCAYAKARQGQNVWAVRGHGGQGIPFIKSWSISKKSRATIFTLGVDTGKDEMAARLRVPDPGPGYCHFPVGEQGESVRGFTERYFLGLTAERKMSVLVRGNFRKYIWEKIKERENEPWDVYNYAGAALAILNPSLDRLAAIEPWAMPAAETPARNSAARSTRARTRVRINEQDVVSAYTAV